MPGAKCDQLFLPVIKIVSELTRSRERETIARFGVGETILARFGELQGSQKDLRFWRFEGWRGGAITSTLQNGTNSLPPAQLTPS
jgi:hypothetical protein